MSPTSSALAGQPDLAPWVGPSGSIPADLRQGARAGGLAIGAMFFALFGALWLLNADQLAHVRGWIPVALVLAVTLLLCLAAWRVLRTRRSAMRTVRDTPQAQRMRRDFRTINTLQWIAAVVVVLTLRRLHLDAWIAPAIMLIVGVHFLPLARVFRYRPHVLTGAVLIVTALLYPIASAGGPASALGSLVAGATLWLAALWSLRPVPG